MKLRHLVPTAGVLAMLSTQAFAAPLTLTCAPGQRAIVRAAFVRGEPRTSASCVDTVPSRAALRQERIRIGRAHRSWGKTALTIAGGAAGGAGIGGIVHGRTGALVGAALGGGAASLYESVKRR
jgi:hypothetical protein